LNPRIWVLLAIVRHRLGVSAAWRFDLLPGVAKAAALSRGGKPALSAARL
jgi:hypothetical protein